MPFTLDTFTHLFDWALDPQRNEKIFNARLEAEFDGVDVGLSAAAARITAVEAGGVANDSITNAKLANMAQALIKGRAAGAGTGDPTDLTSAQVKTILGITASSATGSSNISTTSNSYQDVTGLSVTLSTQATPVLVLASIPMKTSSGVGFATLALDGVDGAVLGQTLSTADETLTFFQVYSVSAASHTWKVRYRNNDGSSTIALNMASIQNGTLAVIVL